MSDHADQLRRVYVHLKQLADNPPRKVMMTDIQRYNELLDRLEGLGFDTRDFRFDLRRDTFVGEYTSQRMRPDVFARMVQALIYYFEVRDKPVIFSGPVHQQG